MSETAKAAPTLPRHIRDEIERQADEYGAAYEAALAEAFGLTPEDADADAETGKPRAARR